MPKTPKPTTLAEFADSVDIHYSMASRLRSGDRRPSLKLLVRIASTYGLDLRDAAVAVDQGRFPEYLSEFVFDDSKIGQAA